MSQPPIHKTVNQVEKLALVVDDAKSARLALRKQLEKQGLQVDTAESAEAALSYLCHTRPDVIFMDHMMPGMDGFQAIKAIKNDPRTAKIPIMMYTSKEGEVYLSQARALGAIGVLPKQIYHAELGKTLNRLGLLENNKGHSPVQKQPTHQNQSKVPIPKPSATPFEKRHAELKSNNARPVATSSKNSNNDNAEAQRQRQLRAWFARLMVEERQKIRQEIQESSQTIARKVVDELVQAPMLKTGSHKISNNKSSKNLFKGLLLILLMIAPALWFYQLAQHNNAETVRVEKLLNEVLQHPLASKTDISTDNETTLLTNEIEELKTLNERWLQTFQWSLNQNGAYQYAELALNDPRLQQLKTLLSRLAILRFQGVIILKVHTGEFCLRKNKQGKQILAAENMKMEQCDFQQQSLSESIKLSQRQSPAFTEFVNHSPLLQGGLVTLEIQPIGNNAPRAAYPDPARLTSAGQWNNIAALNNRVEFTLISTKP
ncbi:MAG: response regulator [Gammaproteobacteria bacterium]|nr:response regulator [Gammaproteobacteria bacterium]